MSLIALISDVHLPHMSGVDLIRIIRNEEGFEQLPVMIMTSCPHPDVVAACEELEVVAFVEKPVNIAIFTKVIAPLFHSPPAKKDRGNSKLQLSKAA